MKRKMFSASVLLFFTIISEAQVIEEKKAGDEEPKIFTKVQIEGNTNPKAWAEHVRKSTQIPDSILKDIPPGTYTVKVQFIIDKHGYIGQVKAKNDPGYGFAKRAERIVLTYNGKWQPATQCGRNVNAYKEQPITFIIPSNNQPNL